MKDNQNKEEEEKKSNFQKFKEYMASLADKAKETNVGKGFAKLSQTNAYKVITGKAFSRAITIGTIVAGAAGLMAVAPPLLGVMAAGLVMGVAADTYMTYKTRGLYKEARNLRDNKLALEKQKDLLNKTPQLAKALDGMLFDPSKQAGKSKDIVPKKTEATILNTIGGAVSSALQSAGGFINALVSGNSVSTLVSLATSVTGVVGGATEKYSMSETRANLKEFIEHEQKKDYSPGYDDKKALKQAVDKQRIQTKALEILSTPGATFGGKTLDQMTNKQIQDQFGKLCGQFADRANKIADRNPIVKFGRKIFKNVIRAHDPFSKYIDPNKMHESIIPKGSEIEKELAQKKQQELEKQKEIKVKKLAEPIKESLEKSENSRKSNEGKSASMQQKNKTGGIERN